MKPVIFVDNESDIRFIKNPEFEAEKIDVKYNFVQKRCK